MDAQDSWLTQEFARARARNDKLPRFARPVVTPPVVSAAQPRGGSDPASAHGQKVDDDAGKG